ncbi:hypothetical protein E8D34_08840 [Nocardioides sp. GY 10113]|uniref:hypothetical protein n=1 Tax=Nocardioides sp. GY 10113 TaxID=2569761 RepID=UPI0010A8EE67|nr:hypothetical protein [Nocardioides sp. GY 10113]TIC87766.1 hypothetical protein E8D34_08840 [Nocardioides sp. GY 10113]
MSPIDNWDDVTAVFTGAGTAWPGIFVAVAVLMFVGFLVRMIQHENHAYAQMINHEPVEAGPAAEGEPTVY